MNKELIIMAIREKMFTLMTDQKKRLSDTYFSQQIGLTKATFSRLMNSKEVELKNILKVCKWLNQPIDNFINK